MTTPASESAGASPRTRTSLASRLAPIAGVAIFAAAIWTLHRELRDVHVREIAAGFLAITPGRTALAVALTIASYATLSTADWLAVRYAGQRLSFRRAAVASTSVYAISNVVGFGPFSTNALRQRLYGAWGVDAATVAVIAVMAGAAALLGASAAAGLGLVASAGSTAAAFGGRAPYSITLGVVLLAAAAAGAGAAVGMRRPITWRGLTLSPPPRWTPVMQLAASSADWVVSAAVLWVLLPAGARPELLGFAPIFVFAGLCGAVTGLPGGLGAFDAVIVVLAPEGFEPAWLAALLVYRVVYFAGPLVVAGGVLGWVERARIPHALRRSQGAFESVARLIAPSVFALLAFAAGGMLLLSAATSAMPARLSALNTWLPLGVIEASHFAASILGLILLILASGLQRRLRRAWTLTAGLCVAGGVLALLKGFDWEEAAFLGVVAGLLMASRPAFYRTASGELLRSPRGWIAAIVATLLLAAWAGFMANRHVAYSNELWWRFVLHGDASRFLRGMAGVSVAFLMFAVWRLLMAAPAPAARTRLSSADVERVTHVLATAATGHCDANLALLGDKRLMFSPSGESFVQFGVRGRNWIAMGEPVGKPEEIRELLWSFREAADRAGANPVFYAVRRDALGDLVELGLVAQKVGETAIVPLAEFGVEGSKRAALRQARNRALREGASFEVVPPEGVAALLPQLRVISDSWLARHEGGEKGFSLGRFDEGYLRHFPVALVRVHGAPVAFANLWSTADKRELTVDLMRYGDGAPYGVMDFLFVELALWGRANGYETLDLGMAPLSGLDGHRLAPLLSRVGAFVYDVGEQVYGFEGLRKYKDKFDPTWEPLFVAAPGRLLLPVALGDVALLTSGGVLGMLGRSRARHD